MENNAAKSKHLQQQHYIDLALYYYERWAPRLIGLKIRYDHLVREAPAKSKRRRPKLWRIAPEWDFLFEPSKNEAESCLRGLRLCRLSRLTERLNTEELEKIEKELHNAICDWRYYLDNVDNKSAFGVDPSSRSGKGRHLGGNSGPSEW